MEAPDLETRRLLLSPLAPDDVDALHAVLREEPVRRYLLDGQEMGRDWVAGVVAHSARDFAERGLGLWGIRLRDEARLLGMTGFRDFYDPPVEELLYALHPDAWGRGLAEEAARAAIAHAFALGRERIRASTDAPNEASLRLMLRLGFVETAREPAPPDSLWEQVHCELARPA